MSILILYSLWFYSACSHIPQVYTQRAVLKIMKQSFKICIILFNFKIKDSKFIARMNSANSCMYPDLQQ
jgi:hypothetical protein